METAESSARSEIPCRHLRSKEMYHQSQDDDSFASGVYWCTLTQETFGPDGQPACKKECCQGRGCYLS